MPSDAELLDAWRGGDLDAGRELFSRHISLVSRFLRNKVGDEREDLMQRTFLALVEARDRLREGDSFRAYLLRTAQNLLYDHFLKASRAHNRPDPLVTSVIDTGWSPSRILAASERDRLLLHALQTLPLATQILLELHYWEGLTTAELAVVVDVPQGTVKTRLLKARQLLRDAMAALPGLGALPGANADDLDAWARGLRASLDAEP